MNFETVNAGAGTHQWNLREQDLAYQYRVTYIEPSQQSADNPPLVLQLFRHSVLAGSVLHKDVNHIPRTPCLLPSKS